jgi:hypothetical protein
MGSWTLHIEGHGIHDNHKEEDADAMLEKFVASLKAAGHVVNRASFTVGARRVTHEQVRDKDTTNSLLHNE